MVFPAETAAPVDKMIPFSKGNDEFERSKYPKLLILFIEPFTVDCTLEISTQPAIKRSSISS